MKLRAKRLLALAMAGVMALSKNAFSAHPLESVR